MYNPIDISYFFLKNYGQDYDITPMKLVKLVYISHGWYIGITGNPLIDENPEAWKYGPVIPRIYHHFKPFGRSPIKIKAFPSDPDKILPEEIKSFLRKIWDTYGGLSGIELSSLTHQTGTPWFQVWQGYLQRQASNKTNFGVVSGQIPGNLIKDYYKKKLLLNKEQSTIVNG
jgi:uncharacterized phage-associated protein